MMETIDKLDRIGWIVYIGSVAGMLFLVILEPEITTLLISTNPLAEPLLMCLP